MQQEQVGIYSKERLEEDFGEGRPRTYASNMEVGDEESDLIARVGVLFKLI